MSKRSYVVLTDSACDMPLELEQKYGIEILPFHITVDGKGYVEREDFTFEEYYELLRNCEKVPSTAQVTMPRFLEKFLAYDEEGVGQVLYISINGTGSSTKDSAIMAVNAFRESRPNSTMNIQIVDSHTYSMCYGWFVAQAAKKLQNGGEMAAVVEWLEDEFSRVEVVLGAYSLKFMKKSGRISAAAAFAGELLGLRPVISLIDGKSVVQKKVRGDSNLIPALFEFANKHIDDTFEYMIGGTSQPQMEELAALCKKQWKTEPVTLFKLGAAVATNTGPDAVAIVYMGQPRPR